MLNDGVWRNFFEVPECGYPTCFVNIVHRLVYCSYNKKRIVTFVALVGFTVRNNSLIRLYVYF